MMLQRLKHDVLKMGLKAGLALGLSLVAFTAGAGEAGLYAVVPTSVIYPGQTIQSSQVKRVEVTNPNLSGDYAQDFSQVEGKVTKRTLLPNHAIYVSALREPFAVSRGSQVRLVYENGSLQISALGTSLDDGGIGDLVKVRNNDSGLSVAGTVTANNTVRVVEK